MGAGLKIGNPVIMTFHAAVICPLGQTPGPEGHDKLAREEMQRREHQLREEHQKQQHDHL